MILSLLAVVSMAIPYSFSATESAATAEMPVATASAPTANSGTPGAPNESKGSFNLADVARRSGGGLDLNTSIGVTPLTLGDLGGTEFTRRLSFRADVGYLFVREPAYWGFGGTFGLGPRHTFQAGPYVSLVDLWRGFWGSAAFLMNTNGDPLGSFSAGWSMFGAEFQVSREEPVFFITLRIPIGIPIWATRYDREHNVKQ